MPLISTFFGIAIYMYFDDHAPPHFHAKYGGDQVLIDIRELRIIAGKTSPRALGLIIEWANLHQKELLENWYRGEKYESFHKIDPLS
ncbi:MAG: DUF4160 domain-containing protein [Bacteroidia bacterium]|nr:DUF4160 domain-containing protein [Bacteroidia bacterium]